jgi:hypothetical protein
MAKQRKQYTEEFRQDAVRMMRNRGSRTVAAIADDLGVGPNVLHRWAASKKPPGQAAAGRTSTSKLSPPVPKGTIFTGITGTRVPRIFSGALNVIQSMALWRSTWPCLRGHDGGGIVIHHARRVGRPQPRRPGHTSQFMRRTGHLGCEDDPRQSPASAVRPTLAARDGGPPDQDAGRTPRALARGTAMVAASRVAKWPSRPGSRRPTRRLQSAPWVTIAPSGGSRRGRR